MPGYGDMTAGAASGFYHATAGRLKVGGEEYRVALDRVNQSGSLLAHNFNALLCGPVNYFAMLHSDVEPEEGWLDKLIEEMEDRDLDMLGAVVPIKDLKGLTSIALQNPSGDAWRPLCRLTMKEVMSLPETFTAEDTGYDLLLNTGCWVCRFDSEVAKKVHFTIRDAIHFDEERGIHVAEVEPEDWYFSRRMREQGVRIGATRKVRLTHAGHMRFSNAAEWGHLDFDSEYVRESVLPKGDGFRFPHDVEGWLLEEEGRALANLARGKRVLEIGSYCGKSTVCMAQTATQVLALDPFDGRSTPRPQETHAKFRKSLDIYGVTPRVFAVHGTLNEVAEPWKEQGELFDLIFIDGAHDLESVRSDIEGSLQFLAPDGLLAFHDYRKEPGACDGRWDPGVNDAVNELLAAGGELISTHATVAVVKPPALIPSEVYENA
jgi:predicted O-methyltransferase YrrM